MAKKITSDYSGLDEAILRLFLPLSNRYPTARIQALDSVEKHIEGLVDGYASPKSPLLENNHDCGDCSLQLQLSDYLPILLRLSLMCPLKDVRERCTAILEELQSHGIKIPRRVSQGPSYFIPDKDEEAMFTCYLTEHVKVKRASLSQVVPHSSEEEQTQMLFVDAFLQNNRLDHITQVMGYHPQYLEAFLRTQHYMLRGDGPLPYDYRHYIAIMAAARHQCSYLINQQRMEYLLQGGDDRWLHGIQHVPQKLRDLNEINKILAHRPWLINKSHIEKLTKGKDNWSLSEVVHAVVILAHFHALCSFVYGCGINAEIDHENGHTYRPSSISDSNESNSSSTSSSPSSIDNEGGVEALMQRMKKLTEEASEETSHEELVKRFEKIESQSAELSPGGDIMVCTPKEDVLRYVDDPHFMYQDFAKRGAVSDIPTFRVQDYSWDDHGYSLVNRLYSDIGPLLDEKFKLTQDLTYNTMGSRTDVDTSLFRLAIWNYIHCMFGIRHDDYDYGEVNQLLERGLKAYVKTVCCYPERTTKKEYDGVMREFKHSEKVHVNLMLLEARMQAEMLYALRAIMRYMT